MLHLKYGNTNMSVILVVCAVKAYLMFWEYLVETGEVLKMFKNIARGELL